MEHIIHQLTNRRWQEKTIGYAESHDQALVGDKTLSMWLFDEQTYTNMSLLNEETPKIFRGIALHKMIRLLTMTLGGHGYLNFIGNEWGHPEWIDFPREGNGWSYKHCTRKWKLAEDPNLRYHFLDNFDKAMIRLHVKAQIIESASTYIRTKHTEDKVIVYEWGHLLLVYNFHWDKSYENYQIYCKNSTVCEVLWSTDDTQFGGHGRVTKQKYDLNKIDSFTSSFGLYLPTRTAIVINLHYDPPENYWE